MRLRSLACGLRTLLALGLAALASSLAVAPAFGAYFSKASGLPTTPAKGLGAGHPQAAAGVSGPATAAGRMEGLRSALLLAINGERDRAGVRPLLRSRELDRVAQARAEEMAAQPAAHPPPGDQDPTAVFTAIQLQLTKVGYTAHAWVESFSALAGDPPAVIAFWRQDPTSKEAMREDFRDVGIGVANLHGVPLYTFFFAWPERAFYARQSAPLADLAAVRAEMLRRVNEARAAAGAPPLTADPRLDEAAQAHAEDMLAHAYYSHVSLEGTRPQDRVAISGFPADTVAENIAARHLTVREAMEGWLASPGHRRNILDPRLSSLGVGVAVGSWEHRYQVLWVQDFAHPRF